MHTFVQYLITFCGQPEAASDVISSMFVGPTVLKKRVKFHSKPSEVVLSTVFPYNFRPEVDTDVISGTAIDNVGMDVPIKFGNSRSNGFRDIRGVDFVSNERTLRSLSQ